MIKILHTADLHFGLEFSRFPTISDKLKEERFKALETLVQWSNDNTADVFVVAGDLFEKLSVSHKIVKRVKEILSKFRGDLIVIPGNHDWYNSSADNKMWTWFLDAPGSNVHFLKDLKSFRLSINNRDVIFYPCGCHQKHCNENRIDWVNKEVKEDEAVQIGIAHGNVEGYGLDDEGDYFPMTESELKQSGVDCWLLGHIHAPYPRTADAGHEILFFAGNHCADNWKSERSGGAWLIQIDDNKKVKATRWNHNGICFKDRAYQITNISDVQQTISELKDMDPSNTVLRVVFNGALAEQELDDAKIQLMAVLDEFLYNDPQWNITLKITAEDIDRLYVKDSISHQLLSNLAQTDDPLAMQLAYQTIKNLSK